MIVITANSVLKSCHCVMIMIGSAKYGSLEVTAEVARPKLSLLGENRTGLLDNFDFGSLFFGEEKKATAILVNNGKILFMYTSK